MTAQTTFLIAAPVKEGHLDAVRALLSQMASKPGLARPDNDLIPFAAFGNLHMARVCVIEADTWQDIAAHGIPPVPYPPHLIFLGDIDGERERFLRQLEATAEPGLRTLFSHCDGFNSQSNLLRWMRAHNVVEAANYVNMRGRTVSQIAEEDALMTALKPKLTALIEEIGSDDAFALHARLKRFVAREVQAGRITLSPPEPEPFHHQVQHWIEKIGVPLILIALLPLTLLLAPILIGALRVAERADPEILPRPDDAKVAALGDYEDHDVTNAFTAFGDLKPGLFRKSIATIALYLLNYACVHIYPRGYLTRVQTIHFARWVYLDNKRRVLFCSNYDGALESYMDDFVNKVAWGLNIVFSNGVGYPSTRFLFKDGAEQEQKFKRFLRNRQQATDVWYKAYPGLTARDLVRHSEVRKGLEQRPRGARGLRNWLAKI